MLSNVAAVMVNGFGAFELGVVCEVFGVDRTGDGLPSYDFAIVAGEPGPLRSSAGFVIDASYSLDRLDAADLVAVLPPGDERCVRADWPEPMLAALRRAVERGAQVLSVCTGAFALGAAGLLDGRSCTTHWVHAAQLARMYPAAKVDPSVLYVDDEPVITSAGTASGIDACLYLVRKEQGSRVANAIARRMVVPPHRDGGQAQYVDTPVGESAGDTLGEVIEWMQRNLDRLVTVERTGPPGRHVATHFCPPLRGGDRHDAAAMAHRPAHPARPAAPRGHRRDDRLHSGTGWVRERGHFPASLPGVAKYHTGRLPAGIPTVAHASRGLAVGRGVASAVTGYPLATAPAERRR